MLKKIAKFTVIPVILFIGVIFVLSSNSNFKDVYISSAMVPDASSSYLYIKDFQYVRKKFKDTVFFKRMEKNYIYQDFNYKYARDLDLIFIKYNINMGKFFDLIQKDVLIGKTRSGYFTIASVNVKTKVMYGLLNLLPETSISNTTYKNNPIYSVNKGSRQIFYSVVNKYLILAESKNTIKTIIDNNPGGSVADNPDDTHSTCSEHEVILALHMSKPYNKYRILPELTNLELKIDITSGNSQIIGLPKRLSEFTDTPSPQIDSYEMMKYMDKEFSLVYFNKTYSLSYVLGTLAENYNRADDEYGNYDEIMNGLEGLTGFKDGAFFGMKKLGFEGESSTVNPELVFGFEMDTQNEPDIQKSAHESLLKTLGFVLGVDEWQESNEGKIRQYKSTYNEFTLLAFDNYYFLTSTFGLASSISQLINKNQPSMYDTYFDKLSQNNNTPDFYSCINPAAFIASIEPVFQTYMSGKIYLEKDEYDKSFGDAFGFLKEKSPILMSITYNQDYKALTGTMEYVK